MAISLYELRFEKFVKFENSVYERIGIITKGFRFNLALFSARHHRSDDTEKKKGFLKLKSWKNPLAGN